jgi:hypothetical protein
MRAFVPHQGAETGGAMLGHFRGGRAAEGGCGPRSWGECGGLGRINGVIAALGDAKGASWMSNICSPCTFAPRAQYMHFSGEVLVRCEIRLLLCEGIDYIVTPSKGSFLSLLSLKYTRQMVDYNLK